MARHVPEEHGTVPAAHPSDADTKVTDRGANPAGNEGAGDTVVVGANLEEDDDMVVGAGATATGATVDGVGCVDGVVAGALVVVVAGLGATSPIRDDPPAGQYTTAKLIPAAMAAVAAARARGQYGRSRCTGAGAGYGAVRSPSRPG
jgi:hypothetical protein